MGKLEISLCIKVIKQRAYEAMTNCIVGDDLGQKAEIRIFISCWNKNIFLVKINK